MPLAQERSMCITFAPLSKSVSRTTVSWGLSLLICFFVFCFVLHNLSTRIPTWVMSEGEAVFLRLGHHLLFLKMEMRQPAKTGTRRTRITNPNRLAKDPLEELSAWVPFPVLSSYGAPSKATRRAPVRHRCPVGSLPYASPWNFIIIPPAPLLWPLSHINLNCGHLGTSHFPF